jgi:hypothetical protein
MKDDATKLAEIATLAMKAQKAKLDYELAMEQLKKATDALSAPQVFSRKRVRITPGPEPRVFLRVNSQERMDKVLDLCAQGKTNHAVELATGISAGQVNRCRRRSRWIENYWHLIDDWKRRHPGADLEVPSVSEQRRGRHYQNPDRIV